MTTSVQKTVGKAEWLQGLTDALPILVAVIPFGALFGAVAVKSGLDIPTAVFASASIYAGASQFVMLDLLGQQVPVWSIILAVFAVNFRHVLYSASISQHLDRFTPLQKALSFFFLVDPQFATGEARAEQGKLTPAYYFGYAAPLYSVWILVSWMGALFGGLIEDPAVYGIDFILPLYFMGLVMGFRQRRFFWPILGVSATVSMIAYFTLGNPWHIAAGGIAGMLLGAAMSKPPEAK
ncbi:AzlC family ABC transporter permease [Maritalea porphyrae]|uniref:Branched-chain amino acid ABC transporter permease n=1 Tax=Maritalea porphyrae TaxID=880732 RepID=A0ABQ5UT18_9HYPH|nr:AzlC family ABC transporter permease [Maritalea porphyrae]GLQ18039.1 branched-chain amino acid ABC transporter permease [Maritalea porphyrae]